MTVFLRPCEPSDQDFLFTLYASTRQDEFAAAGWGPAQLEAFLRLQFMSQRRWYETAYHGAEEHIVMRDTEPIGRLLVHRGDGATTLVDISLLPAHRSQGAGAELLRGLIEECRQARVPLRLQVLHTNPAQRLYQRLGFVKTGEDELYMQMQRTFD